jgi:rare lipoprotein A
MRGGESTEVAYGVRFGGMRLRDAAAQNHARILAQMRDPARMSAAHRSLPLATRVKVINLATEQSVEVVINDRWGGGQGRIINLSDRAAKDVGFGSGGTSSVRIEVIELGKGMAYTEPGSAGHTRSVASAPVLPAQIRSRYVFIGVRQPL